MRLMLVGLFVILGLGGCSEMGLSEAEIAKKVALEELWADFNQVNEACGIDGYTFEVEQASRYEDVGPPAKGKAIVYFALDDFTNEQAECIGETKGSNGYSFVVKDFEEFNIET